MVGWVIEGPLFILKTGLRLNHGQLASCPHGGERQESGQSASRKAIDEAILLEGSCVRAARASLLHLNTPLRLVTAHLRRTGRQGYVAAMKNKAEGVAESKRSMGTLGLSSPPPPHLSC